MVANVAFTDYNCVVAVSVATEAADVSVRRVGCVIPAGVKCDPGGPGEVGAAPEAAVRLGLKPAGRPGGRVMILRVYTGRARVAA